MLLLLRKCVQVALPWGFQRELGSGQLRELCLQAALPKSVVLAAGTQIHRESSSLWAHAQQCCLSLIDFCDQLVPFPA